MSSLTAVGLPPSIRACLFDLDGVLTPTAKLHAAAWKQVFDEYLLEELGERFAPFDLTTDYERYVDGRMRMDGIRSFLASRHLHAAEQILDALAHRKDELFVHLLHEHGVDPYDGSVQFLRAVRSVHLRTAVVSSSKHCREVICAANIDDLLDERIDGITAERDRLAGKPAPDTYLAAARRFGIPPTEAAVFEDALSGVEAGRAGGFGYVVGVDRVGQAEQLRKHGADTVVTNLAVLLRSSNAATPPRTAEAAARPASRRPR